MLWATATLTTLAGVSACSDEGDKQPQAAQTPASRICDGTLDRPAVTALQRLGGADSFEELSGKGNQFSLDRAAAHVHDDVQQRSRCTVYLPDDTSGAPLVQLDFKAADTHPTRAAVLKASPGKDFTFYALGAYAATSDKNSTTLYFQCTTKGSDGKRTRYVDAGIFSSAGQLKGNSPSKDRMVILNSVSRHLADKLGCADEAHLPSTVPDGESVTS
ncbi:hypothetical protein GCM10018793_66040 [Streptomyces sulfonofaciens]|uniref:Uncharacterized protein n=1 Tax=Streptomyces sulfonofaciens TaxID=68272 RepID=A0A919GQ46_9ACTN|nr:hypothetical protein GCM10018793_66040 [Streptomyces sulfonofaciens]